MRRVRMFMWLSIALIVPTGLAAAWGPIWLWPILAALMVAAWITFVVLAYRHSERVRREREGPN